MATKTIKSISRKALIINFLIIILLLFTFQRLFTLASEINNELSYKNYLAEQKKLNTVLFNNSEVIEIEKIKFPLYIQGLILIILILLIEAMYTLADTYYFYNKQQQTKNINNPTS